VSFRYRALQQFTKWLADEEELPTDLMARMRPPQVPEDRDRAFAVEIHDGPATMFGRTTFTDPPPGGSFDKAVRVTSGSQR